MKRIMFGVVAFSLTLAACGPSDEEMLTQIEPAPHIYIAQKLELPKSFATIKAACGQLFY